MVRATLTFSTTGTARSEIGEMAAAYAAYTPNLMFPSSRKSHQERVDTDVRSCSGRLSWRHRARPSTTLHEIQARSKGANLNCSM